MKWGKFVPSISLFGRCGHESPPKRIWFYGRVSLTNGDEYLLGYEEFLTTGFKLTGGTGDVVTLQIKPMVKGDPDDKKE